MIRNDQIKNEITYYLTFDQKVENFELNQKKKNLRILNKRQINGY